MLFTAEITVPANTTEDDPQYTTLKLSRGVITRVSYRPRPGHAGLVHVQVLYNEYQLIPASRGEDLHGDAYPIEWDEHEEINIEPYVLKIRSWNLDDSYEHSFDISFAVLPWSATLYGMIARALADVVRMISPSRILGRS